MHHCGTTQKLWEPETLLKVSIATTINFWFTQGYLLNEGNHAPGLGRINAQWHRKIKGLGVCLRQWEVRGKASSSILPGVVAHLEQPHQFLQLVGVKPYRFRTGLQHDHRLAHLCG